MRIQLGLALCACGALLVGCGGGASMAPTGSAAPVAQSGAVQPAGTVTSPGGSTPGGSMPDSGAAPAGADIEPLLHAELDKLLASTQLPGPHPPNLPAQRPQLVLKLAEETMVQGDLPTVTLSWSEDLPGDFNLDGVVDAQDLTPLVKYFGQTTQQVWPDPVASDSGQTLADRLDDDGDGHIGFGDLPAIARNWNVTLDGFNIYRRTLGSAAWQHLANATNAESPLSVVRNDFTRSQRPPYFNYVDRPTTGEYEYKVVPVSSNHGGEGLASLPLATAVRPDSAYSQPVFVPVNQPEVLGQATTFSLVPNVYSDRYPVTLDFDWGDDGTYDTQQVLPAYVNHVDEPVRFDSLGEQLIMVRATDVYGFTSYGLAEFEVRSVNHPPVLQPDVILPETATPAAFYATTGGSYDPDGDQLSYHFDLLEPGQTDYVSALSYDYLTVPGPYTLRVTAADPLGATTVWTHNFVLSAGAVNPQWTASTVLSVSSENGRPEVDCAVTGGKPSVLMLDYQTGVSFRRALDAEGQHWPTSASPVATGVPSYSAGGLSDANGRPAVMLYTNTAAGLGCVYTVGLDEAGQAWSAPHDFGLTGHINELGQAAALLDGRPALVLNDTDGQLHVFQANDAYGLDWPAAGSVVPDLTGSFPQLLSLAGSATIMFAPAIIDPNPPGNVIAPAPAETRGAAALLTAPAGMALLRRNAAGAWQLAQSLPSTFFGFGPAQIPATGGAPLIFNEAYDFTSQRWQAGMQRALDPQGNVWGPAEQVPVPLASGGTPRPVASFADGRPCVVYCSPNTANLVWIQALDAGGAQWSLPVELDNRDRVWEIEAVVTLDGQPAVLYWSGIGLGFSDTPESYELRLLRRQ